MTVERTLEYDEATKLLKVRAINEDSLTMQQVKDIYADLDGKLKNAEAALKQFKDVEFALKKMDSEPRLKEIVEVISKFAQLRIPEAEGLKRSVKFYEEQIAQLNKDINQLKPFLAERVEQSAGEEGTENTEGKKA